MRGKKVSETREEQTKRTKGLEESFSGSTGPKYEKWLKADVEMMAKIYGQKSTESMHLVA